MPMIDLTYVRGSVERPALERVADELVTALLRAERAPDTPFLRDNTLVYLHELDGFAVRLPDETPLGLVSSVYELPSGLMIEVQGPKREFLLPYKKEFVREVDRAGRRLVVRLPEGLVE